MAQELSLTALEEMSKAAEFIKAFKQKALWKKAKGILILEDHKELGKKMSIAIPYRKFNELKEDFKRIKKDKIHPLKKVGAGILTLTKGEDGGAEFQIEIKYGGVKGGALIQKKLAPMFSKIQAKVKFTGMEGQPQATDGSANQDKTTDAKQEQVGDINKDENIQNKQEGAVLLQQFGQKAKTLKPELAKLKTIVANIKGNKVTAKDLDEAGNILDHVASCMELYEQLTDAQKEKYKDFYAKMKEAAAKAEQVNDKLMMMDSDDEEIMEKQRVSLENEMKRILKKNGIKLDF